MLWKPKLALLLMIKDRVGEHRMRTMNMLLLRVVMMSMWPGPFLVGDKLRVRDVTNDRICIHVLCFVRCFELLASRFGRLLDVCRTNYPRKARNRFNLCIPLRYLTETNRENNIRAELVILNLVLFGNSKSTTVINENTS